MGILPQYGVTSYHIHWLFVNGFFHFFGVLTRFFCVFFTDYPGCQNSPLADSCAKRKNVRFFLLSVP